MEVLQPDKEVELVGIIDPFSDLYFMNENFSDHIERVNDDICRIVKPVHSGAQVTSLVFSIIGMLINLIVLFVMLVLKEHKKSRVYWFLLHIMLSNVIFLACISFQMGNELNGQWATGHASCQMNEASLFSSHAAGITFLVIANICGFLPQLKVIFSWLPRFHCSQKELLKSIFLILLVWFPCCLINLPIYKFSAINNCRHCSLEFPIHDGDYCDILSLNSSLCAEFLKIIAGESNATIVIDDGNSTTDSGDAYDFYGDLYNVGSDEFNDDGDLSFLEMSACKYEEPRGFFLWLYASFGLFYVTPLPIFAFFIVFYIYDSTTRKTTDKNKEQDAPALIIIVLDTMFFILCTPWNVVQMRKANGGIGPGDGKSCAAAVNYARLSTIIYYILMPCVYGYTTARFHNRLMTSVATSIHFFHRVFGWFTKKSTIVTSEKKHSSSECDREGDSDVTNETEIEKTSHEKVSPPTIV